MVKESFPTPRIYDKLLRKNAYSVFHLFFLLSLLLYNFVGEVAVRSFGDFPEMEKENLLTEIRNGNRAAFDELCREELPVLLSYARAFLYDKWADDVVQDVLFSFWKNRESLKSDCAVRRYLLRSVYNRSLN